MNRFALVSATILMTNAYACGADDTTIKSDKPSFLLLSVEERYASESAKAEALVAKADSESVKLKKSAAEVRLKAYKARLVEVTKTGDFDKALQVKARISELEDDTIGAEDKVEKPAKRSRPEDTVKFSGHTYALIKELTTWHLAKQACEEMGGRLVCINSPQEEAFVGKLCGPLMTQIGATDEREEGKWMNVDGTPAVFSAPQFDNLNGLEHWMLWDGKHFVDWHAGARAAYVCEWDK